MATLNRRSNTNAGSTLFARVSGQGTACAETAFCAEHFTHENRLKFDNPNNYPCSSIDCPTGPWKDVTGNDALSCNVCGIS